MGRVANHKKMRGIIVRVPIEHARMLKIELNKNDVSMSRFLASCIEKFLRQRKLIKDKD